MIIRVVLALAVALAACTEEHEVSTDAGSTDAGFQRLSCRDPGCQTGTCCRYPDGGGYCCSTDRWDRDSGASFCVDEPACDGRDGLWACCGDFGKAVYGRACLTLEEGLECTRLIEVCQHGSDPRCPDF